MAITMQTLSLVASAMRTISDADADSTAEKHIAGTSCTIHAIRINNAANAAEAEYVKLYNSAVPTVGTTAPEMILPVAGSANNTWIFKNGLDGIFTTAVSAACVQEAGTAGTTSPSSNTLIDVTLYA